MSKVRNLGKLSRLLLTRLLESEKGLSAFSLFKSSGVSFDLFTDAISKLERIRYISNFENHLKITKYGIKYILQTSQAQGEKSWRNVPDELRRNKIDISDKYIPSRSKLTKDFEL